VCSLNLAPTLLADLLGEIPKGPQEWATALWESTALATLDTETSALHGWVVDLAVCGLDGQPFLDTLATPQGPISRQAKAIHGIGVTMLCEENAPIFSSVLDHLGGAIDGRCVVAYNLRIAREVHRHARLTVGLDDAEALTYTGTWLQRARWADLMILYAQWFGEWNSYHHDYQWQELPYSNHRAVGDAAGAAQLFRELADGTAPRLPEDERGPQPYDDADDMYA
jgi:DNA polymerase III subunit epsilon